LEILALHLQAVFPIIAQAFSFFSNQKGLFCRFLHSFSLPQQKRPLKPQIISEVPGVLIYAWTMT
jgi:hypothetical protein